MRRRSAWHLGIAVVAALGRTAAAQPDAGEDRTDTETGILPLIGGRYLIADHMF